MICLCDSATASNFAPASGRPRTLAARLAICALLAAVSGERAAAADLFDTSFLRGSLGSGSVQWDGVVLGGQIAYSAMHSNFGNSTSSQIAFVLRDTSLEDQFAPSNWTTLSDQMTNARSFGLFLGYNVQMSDLVLGGDIAYNKVSKANPSATDSINRTVTLSNGTVDNVNIHASSSTKLIDYGTFRGRAGWSFGQFLPYAMIGGAVGRFDYVNTSQVTVGQTPSGGSLTTFVFPTQTDSKNNAFSLGFLYGLGMDVAITPNIFLRAEWEYIAFGKVGGTLSTLNTARAGLGVRF